MQKNFLFTQKLTYIRHTVAKVKHFKIKQKTIPKQEQLHGPVCINSKTCERLPEPAIQVNNLSASSAP